MPNIKRETIVKYNNQLANGFTFDVYMYCGWGEKTALKNIEIDDKHFWRARIRYHPLYQEVKNYFGQTFMVQTGRYAISLGVTQYAIRESISGNRIPVSCSNPKFYNISDGSFERRDFKKIIEISKKLTKEEILGYTRIEPSPDEFIWMGE